MAQAQGPHGKGAAVSDSGSAESIAAGEFAGGASGSHNAKIASPESALLAVRWPPISVALPCEVVTQGEPEARDRAPLGT